ncbi:hypothetical protein E2562_034592 [Oryza meyeriana var. granulata]|uniref:F-box protein AT5G49610-like beta-propeller domain-containing protein n=1 Tax=Oryza meyeriana var. granulata TaxID=110450 RepID=A0A6G1DRU7_9ORYZ|nr:hypothetical protein E2562_034592 [Oryza meyeriana var. granulata]KAF0915219.1 hypothetical protein E2562_034592 [Oryza meyeriana var. granulata]KAF0915222.1 hypothetical protein E2562_034592 [Oryza meyeriana var. granulata]
MTGSLDLFPPPPNGISDDSRGYFNFMDYHIVSSDEVPGLFCVIGVYHDESRLRAAVLLSETREWKIFPWADAGMPPSEEDRYWLHISSRANGSIYWLHTIQPYILVLDIATMHFSRIDLPQELQGQGYMFRVGEAKDGKLCTVCAIDFTLFVWFWRTDGDGVEKWVLDKMIPLQEVVVEAIGGSPEDHAGVKVMEIINGFVYLSTYETFIDANFPGWFLSFCLETSQLQKFFQKRYDSHVHPYIMAWPPSLVGNKAVV